MGAAGYDAHFRMLCKALADEHGTSLVFEHRFHPTRRWRFDAAFPDRRVAVELDGGAWTGGRHTRGKGFTGDCEKINAAQLLGWRVYRFVPAQLYGGEFMATLGEALGGMNTR